MGSALSRANRTRNCSIAAVRDGRSAGWNQAATRCAPRRTTRPRLHHLQSGAVSQFEARDPQFELVVRDSLPVRR
jgi:hypothetical protein